MSARVLSSLRGALLAGACASALILGGCQTVGSWMGKPQGRPESPRLKLVEQWSQTILDFGHFPVVPMREDLRVGDVYAIADEPVYQGRSSALGLRLAATTRWGSVDVNPLLDKEYRKRPAWLTTDTANERADLAQAAMNADGGGILPSLYSGQDTPIRHRLVALQGLSATPLSTDELEPFLPPEIAPLITGPISEDNLALTIRVGSAENYTISQDLLLERLLVEKEGAYGPEFFFRDQPHTIALVARPGTEKMYVVIVTEVIYIRTVDVTLRSKIPLPGLQEKSVESHPFMPPAEVPPEPVEEPGEEQNEEGEVVEVVEVEAEVEVEEAPPVGTPHREIPDRFHDAFARAGELNELFKEIDVDAPLNGTLRFVSATDTSVTIRRTWPRGLAISGKGITFEVNPTTGQVKRVGPLGIAFRDPIP